MSKIYYRSISRWVYWEKRWQDFSKALFCILAALWLGMGGAFLWATLRRTI